MFVQMTDQSPVFIELLLAYLLNIKINADLEFAERVLKLFEIEHVLILVLGREDDAIGEDGARSEVVDDAAIDLTVS
jgi:hypothetical protein